MPPRYWRRAWKTKAWLRRLSGPICGRLAADRGVELWISSLRDTRASRSASPVSVVASRTLVTYGLMSRESSTRQGQLFASAKMSPLICHSDLTLSSKTWKAWATSLRRECSRRGLSERPIKGRGSSGSLPTPRTGTSHGFPGEGLRHPSIIGAVRRMLPTPRANRGGFPDSHGSVDAWKLALPTPTAMDSVGAQNATANRSPDAKPHQSGTTLCDVIWRLPTPSATDHKGSAQPGQRRGQLSEIEPGTGGRLHPQFTEWMMGWPIGWTACEPAETGSFRKWLETHSSPSWARSSGDGSRGGSRRRRNRRHGSR